MLLVLSDLIRAELPRVLATPELCDALSNLARAHYEGKHIVSASAALLGRLGDARELPAETRGIWKQIKLRHPEAATVRASVTHVVEIEPGEGDEMREDDDGAQRRFRVPLAYFSDSEHVQVSRLVAEDPDDARAYERVARAYAHRRVASNGLCIRIQGYGGGGSRTAETLRDHATHGPTVCVVDADYKWSDSEGIPTEGETAQRARAAARSLARRAICAVHAAPCREIENMLPRDLVLSCFVVSDAGDFHRRCVAAAELGLLGGDASINRVDLKDGLRWHDVQRHPEGHPRRRYLARIFEERRGRVAKPDQGWCDDERRCAEQERDSCRCVLFEGLGEKVLTHVADQLDKMSPQKVGEALLAEGEPHAQAWTAIGKLLFSWGCAYARSRT